MHISMKSVLFTSALAFASPALAAGTAPDGSPLADDQTFTYRNLDEFTSVDPQIVEDTDGADMVRDLFEGLYNQDADGNLVPGVALSHTLSDDRLTYTFTLRPEAMWSDGTPVTAGDFVYGWRRLADPETASPYQWFVAVMNLANGEAVTAGEMPIEDLGVDAPDDHTLVVTLATPMSYFPLTTTHGSTFPSPSWVIEEHGADWTKPENLVSNGAYVLTEHVPQERSVRSRNEMYWDNENTIIEQVVALVINDENVALTRYLAGELDRTDAPAGQYPALKAEYPDDALTFPRLCNYYFNFNLTDLGPEATQDVRVRKALAYAVDRDIIVEKVMQGGQFPAYTFSPAATANFEPPAVDYSTWTQEERNAKALELLAEAGYGPDNPLSFSYLYNTSEGHKDVAVAVAQMWKQALGVQVTLENQEWKTFLETRGNHDFEIARGAWCGDYNEASTFLDLVESGSGYNDAGFVNEEVDALLAEAKSMDDPSANYTRIEEILAAEMPVIPVYHYSQPYMMVPSISGSWPVQNVEQNWYSKDLYKVAD